MTALRALAVLGVIVLVAIADGIIGGTVEVFGGGRWGDRCRDTVQFGFALFGIWTLTGRLIS